MRRSKRPLIETDVETGARRRRRQPPNGRDGNRTGDPSSRGTRRPEPLATARVPAVHRDTTAALGGAYPFVAGAAETGGMFIGHDTTTGQRFCFDPWRLYEKQIVSNTNIVIIGNIGWGKTNTAMAIALRGIATGHCVLVPGDPKNDWTRLAESLGGQAIRLGPTSPGRLNPLDLGTSPKNVDLGAWRHAAEQRRAALIVAIVEAIAPALAPLPPEIRETLTASLDGLARDNATPTLPQLVARLADEPAATPARAALAVLCSGPLAGMLDQPATATPDPSAPIIAVGTADVADNDLAHTLAVLTATSQLASATGTRRRYVIYDEAWRILASPTHLDRVNSELRLSRAKGTATVLITHALSDTDKSADAGSSAAATARGLVALCDTRIIFRQAPGETARTATELTLTSPERDAFTTLGKGEALWKTGARTRRIHTDLGASEQILFNTDLRWAVGER